MNHKTETAGRDFFDQHEQKEAQKVGAKSWGIARIFLGLREFNTRRLSPKPFNNTSIWITN
jgi:hypothetical protein